MNRRKTPRVIRWSTDLWHFPQLLLLLIFLLVTMTSCTLNVAGDARLPNHVVMLDEKGELIDIGEHDKCPPESRNCNFNYSALNHDDGKKRVTRKIEELRSFKTNKEFCENAGYEPGIPIGYPSATDEYEILIFVHGGLNTQNGSLDRAASLFPKILCEGGYYPVFINWKSSLWSSYGEHLVNVRQGTRYDFLHWQTLLAPTVFVIDIARSLARAPVAWAELFSNDFQGSIFHSAATEHQMLRDLIAEAKSDQGNNITASSLDQMTESSGWKTLWSTFTYFLTLPTKLASVPFIDAFGTSAWSNMQRRTQMLFHTQEESEFNSKVRQFHREKILNSGTLEDLTYLDAQGGLSLFLNELIEKLKDEPKKYKVTLVGHSAGTIILNQLIREFGERIKKEAPNISVSKIVYLAAASTIQDYRGSIWPYLRMDGHTKFYNLMLHNKAEAQDSTVVPFPLLKEFEWDPGPRGSLLVWVDAFLSNPLTAEDRTVGKFTNLMKTVQETPRDIRGQIYLKVFNIGGEYDPVHHAGFGDKFKFWDDGCLDPTQQNEGRCWTEKP